MLILASKFPEVCLFSLDYLFLPVHIFRCTCERTSFVYKVVVMCLFIIRITSGVRSDVGICARLPHSNSSRSCLIEQAHLVPHLPRTHILIIPLRVLLIRQLISIEQPFDLPRYLS